MYTEKPDLEVIIRSPSSIVRYGFELGNELPHIPADVSGVDYNNLHGLLVKYWPDPAVRPKLIGNDVNTNPAYLKQCAPPTTCCIPPMHHTFSVHGVVSVTRCVFPSYSYRTILVMLVMLVKRM